MFTYGSRVILKNGRGQEFVLNGCQDAGSIKVAASKAARKAEKDYRVLNPNQRIEGMTVEVYRIQRR